MENHRSILDRRVMVQTEKQHWQEVQIERLVSEPGPVEAVSSAEVGDSEGYTRSRWLASRGQSLQVLSQSRNFTWFYVLYVIMNNI